MSNENYTNRAKYLVDLLQKSQIFAWSPDISPDEYVLESLLQEANGDADRVLCEILLSSIEMFDQVKRNTSLSGFMSTEETLIANIPRPPLWYWNLFPDEHLVIFGCSTRTDENEQSNDESVHWFKDAGLAILEAVWDSEYIDLAKHHLAPTAQFLDFRGDFGKNWTRLLLLLYHITQNLYSDLGPGKLCSETTRNGLFMRVMIVAIQWELELNLSVENTDQVNFEALSQEEMFRSLRSIFPSAKDLGPFATQAITDESIRTVLVAHEYEYASSLQYLTILCADSLDDSVEKQQATETRTPFTARDVLLHDPELGARRAYVCSAPAQIQKSRSLQVPSLATPSCAPPMKNWQTTIQTLERMLELPINKRSQPRVVCDRQHGLIMQGWGAAPEAGSDLGRPFNRGVMVHRLDLHTVHVREALQLVASVMKYFTELRTRENKMGRLEVGLLVGRGLHSENGPRLGPNLAAFIRRNGVSFFEDEAWLVLRGL